MVIKIVSFVAHNDHHHYVLNSSLAKGDTKLVISILVNLIGSEFVGIRSIVSSYNCVLLISIILLQDIEGYIL
jgi:hypothetical protein